MHTYLVIEKPPCLEEDRVFAVFVAVDGLLGLQRAPLVILCNLKDSSEMPQSHIVKHKRSYNNDIHQFFENL